MISKKAPHFGQVVTSIAGRDKGRYFIVVEVVDSNYVKIADGDLRRIENLKLKKVKHLNISNHFCEDLIKANCESVKLTNERIRKSLEKFTFKTD